MSFTLLRTDANQSAGLKNFIRDVGTSATVMVEVGSYAGESAELFAAVVKEIICIDPWNLSPDMLYAAEAEAQFNMRIAPFFNVVKMKGFSEDVSRFFKPDSFDLVYIDANHDYDHIHADILAWMPLVKDGGHIGGHDYAPAFPGVPRAVNELIGMPDTIYRDSSWVKKIKRSL